MIFARIKFSYPTLISYLQLYHKPIKGSVTQAETFKLEQLNIFVAFREWMNFVNKSYQRKTEKEP